MPKRRKVVTFGHKEGGDTSSLVKVVRYTALEEFN